MKCVPINSCHWEVCQELGKCILYSPVSQRIQYRKHNELVTNKKKRVKKNIYNNKLFKSSEKECFYCGQKLNESNRSIDHVRPKSKGGSNKSNNKIWSCKDCNGSKGNNMLEEWMLIMGNKKGYASKISDEKRLKIITTISYMIFQLNKINV